MQIFSVLFFLISFHAQAEYRVFVLQIHGADGQPLRTVQSTLDPDQYRGYYPLKEGETVTYIDTWRCYGSTNDQPLCPNPRAVQSPESPASNSTTPSPP